MDTQNRRLLWHGMALFLFGLLTGFVEPRFANMRMGLAAHLEGVMNGTFLLALGAGWAHVRLSPRLKTTTFWLALFGTYANWLVTTLAAVFGTVALSPITGLRTRPRRSPQRERRHVRLHARRTSYRGHRHPSALRIPCARHRTHSEVAVPARLAKIAT